MSSARIWIAIPDSLTAESSHLREKTVKVGQIARACAVFRVGRIFLYHDRKDGREEDARTIKTILQYVETPQYLRKHLFGKLEELSYAGLLYPLRTPHHKLDVHPRELKDREVREGVTVRIGGKSYAYVGISENVPLLQQERPGQRVTVRIEGTYPNLTARVIDREGLQEYWGYEIEDHPSLVKLIEKVGPQSAIITSRKGSPVAELWEELVKRVMNSSQLLLIFGSPRRGVQEILGDEEIRETGLLTVNMFPEQGVATIRTEEALLGALAIVNLIRALNL